MTTQPVTKISDVSKASQGQDIRFYLLEEAKGVGQYNLY